VRGSHLLMTLVAVFAAVSLAPANASADTLTGAGSSFDFPFFSRAFYAYHQAHQDVSVNYQSIGSGGGIQQFTAKTVDFGASDVPLTKAETAAAEASNGPVVQVPVTLGGVVVAYNVPGATGHLKMNPDVLSDIFLGKITNWNDGRIGKLNPGATLPNLAILVVHRAEGSGTTYIFTDYLSKVSSEWKSKVGTSKSVSWPAAASVGLKGNEGVAGQIRSTPGAIGYIELAYAIDNDISYAALQNRAGEYVLPSLDAVRTAAAQKPDLSPSNFSIVDMQGKESYPICGYSWVMLWKNEPNAERGKELLDLFRWLVTDGQSQAVSVKYVSLPTNIQTEAEHALASIKT
jgi:phosphate transport system substrate-binding protein